MATITRIARYASYQKISVQNGEVTRENQTFKPKHLHNAQAHSKRIINDQKHSCNKKRKKLGHCGGGGGI